MTKKKNYSVFWKGFFFSTTLNRQTLSDTVAFPKYICRSSYAILSNVSHGEYTRISISGCYYTVRQKQ